MRGRQSIFLYVLKDSRTGVVRYLGQTAFPKQRKSVHSRCYPVQNNPGLTKWFLDLAQVGMTPEFVLIAELSSEDELVLSNIATHSEYEMIRWYRQYNRFRKLPPLLNILPYHRKPRVKLRRKQKVQQN